MGIDEDGDGRFERGSSRDVAIGVGTFEGVLLDFTRVLEMFYGSKEG